MMKKIITTLVLLIAAATILILTFAPAALEKKMNRVINPGPYKVSEKAQALHDTLRVADLHADSLMSKRNLLERSNRGHVDVPRLIDGRVAVQSFTVVTKACAKSNSNSNPSDCDDIKWLAIGSMWPISTWNSLMARALYQANKLHRFEKDSGGKISVIKTSDDLSKFLERREKTPDITSGFLGVEGAHALEGNAENVDVLFNAGYRMIGLAHFFDNEMTGSQHGLEKGGLTDEGRKMVSRMYDKKMICDLAHLSRQGIDDVLAMEPHPAVLVSHTGVTGTCDNNRNLTDEYIRKISDAGGVIGIGYWDTATCGEDVAAIVAAIKHTISVAGIDHVALGSDYDGSINAPFDTSGLALITEGLINDGFSEDDIRKIMGENTISFLLKNLP